MGAMSQPPNIDLLGVIELKALVLELLAKVTEQERTIAALRDEILRLKGGPGRPNIKANVGPSGMDKATDEPRGKGKRGKSQRRRGSHRDKLAITEERRLEAEEVPAGSRFKGYASYLVQDLVIRPQVTLYRRELWQTPDGRMVVAPLPDGIDGHFGPELRRFVLMQYYQGQVTVARLVTLLRSFGIVVSRRQVMRLLNDGKDAFLAEAQAVLQAGLSNAPWVTVDDTGARHKGSNGYCTQIGNDRFTWFSTTGSKSRVNFLELLRAGSSAYVLNEAAFAYMRERALPATLIARLAQDGARRFTDKAAWQAYLDDLNLAAHSANANAALIATEGALWGAVHGLLNGTVIISDDAGQFNVGEHGLCWVHAERLVHKLDTFTEAQRQAQAMVRRLIWRFYRALKAYRRHPSATRKATLRARFDRIFARKTGFVVLDRLLKRLHANKAELLKVLDHPEIPLHTNGSENDIRCHVTKRKISGGTRSDIGRDCRDAFLGLSKTCAKLGISFADYLGARLNVPGAPPVPPLAQLVASPDLRPD